MGACFVRRRKLLSRAVLGSAASALILVSIPLDVAARGFGGGPRGGAAMSMSRGGNFNRSSMGGTRDFNRGGTFSRSGEYSRPGQRGSGTAAGGGDQRPSTRPGQGGSGTQWQRGNPPDYSCPGCRGSGEQWNGWVDHPIAAGVAVAATAAAIGARYYALPAGCAPYAWSGFTYYTCAGVYYEPQYEGDTVVYVVVPNPSGQ